MTRQPRPCPRPARPLGACDASLFPTGHPPVPAESPGHPVSQRLCACGSGHVLSLCLPSSSAASMPSGDLGPPSPSCEGGARKTGSGGQEAFLSDWASLPNFPGQRAESRELQGEVFCSCAMAPQAGVGKRLQEPSAAFTSLQKPPGTVLLAVPPLLQSLEGSGQLWGTRESSHAAGPMSQRGMLRKKQDGGVRLSGLPQTSQGGRAGLGSGSKPSCRVDTGREFAKERPAPAAFPCVLAAPSPERALLGGH